MDKYEKLQVVGRGAYGTVHLCRRLTDRQQLIVKQIPVDQMTKQQRISALNEVIVLSMLKHPNITRYYDNFLEDKSLMIVMEFAEGGTLFDYLQERDGKLLSENEILSFLTQMLLALHHLHSRQILHRDLKTQNLLLDRKKQLLKVSDFGISKVMSKSKAVTVVGTPCYISPELCESKPYNQKNDIWSLGCVLYELATLQRAFEASTLPALILKIIRGSYQPISEQYSSQLRELIADMLQVDPSKRPSAAGILASPLVLQGLISHICDFGALPCIRHKVKQHSDKGVIQKKSSRSFTEVFVWGVGNDWRACQLPLAFRHTQVIQVSLGRTQMAGVTMSGRVVLWEKCLMSKDEVELHSTSPTSHKLPLNRRAFAASYMPGQCNITHVACGHLFIVLVTDRGIVMTYGSGSFGCLGHSDFEDVAKARIVEGLLGYEVVQVSAGSCHVIALSCDNEVFVWGRGDNGRLGLSDSRTHCSPQPVVLPHHCVVRSVHAGVDRSIILLEGGSMYVAGCNRWNKLAYLSFPPHLVFSHHSFPSESVSPPPFSSLPPPRPKLSQLSSSQSSSSQISPQTSPLSSLQTSQPTSSSLQLTSSLSSSSYSFQLLSPTQLFSLKSSSPTFSDVMSFSKVTSSPLRYLNIKTLAMGTSHTTFLTEEGECWCVGSNNLKQLSLSLPVSHACVQVCFCCDEEDEEEDGGDNYTFDSDGIRNALDEDGNNSNDNNIEGSNGNESINKKTNNSNKINNKNNDTIIEIKNTKNPSYITISNEGKNSKNSNNNKNIDINADGKNSEKSALGAALKAKEIACGDAFNVVAMEDDSLWSWGKESRGRLGREVNKTEKIGDEKKDEERMKICDRYLRRHERPGRVELPRAPHGRVVSLCSNHVTTIVAYRAPDINRKT